MEKEEFGLYCRVRGIEPHPELFEKYRDDFFCHVGNDDNLFSFIGDLVQYESGSPEDHKRFTICAVLRCIMNRARKEQNMTYYWAAKLATRMAKRMDAKLKWYKNELS